MEHGAGQLKLSVPPLFLENHANPAFAYFTNYIKNNVLDEYNVAHFLLIARLYFFRSMVGSEKIVYLIKILFRTS